MSRTLTVELDDDEYDYVTQLLAGAGQVPKEAFLDWARLMAVRSRSMGWTGRPVPGAFESHFGSVVLESPSDGSNESIDADLAREYARGMGQ